MQLRDLQEIETEIRRIRADVEKLDSEKLNMGEQLEQYKSQCGQQTEIITSLKKEYKTFSDEVKEKERLIKKSNEKLMSIKNNREYQALLKEVEDLKRSVAEIEDQMLGCLEKTEGAQAELNEGEKALAQARKHVESEHVRIEAEQSERQKRIADLDGRKQALTDQLDDGIMAMFLKIQRLQPDKKPVARALNSACTGCHMNIPAQMFNELHRKGEIRHCPFCHRMLYWEEETEI